MDLILAAWIGVWVLAIGGALIWPEYEAHIVTTALLGIVIAYLMLIAYINATVPADVQMRTIMEICAHRNKHSTWLGAECNFNWGAK